MRELPLMERQSAQSVIYWNNFLNREGGASHTHRWIIKSGELVKAVWEVSPVWMVSGKQATEDRSSDEEVLHALQGI